MVNPHLAADILHLGKTLAPDRFPKPDPTTTQAWARALNRNHPPELWEEAIHVWAAEIATDRMCTPRDLLHACKVVTSRWESHPTRGPQLRAHREKLADQRDQLIAQGKFAESRGYTPTLEPPKPDVDEHFIQQLTQRALHGSTKDTA